MRGRRRDERNEEDNGHENPVIAALDRDLHAVLARTDARLFLFIVLGLVLSHLSSWVHVTPAVESTLSALALVSLIGGIVFTIYSSVTGKRRVGERYGVACRACGFRPKLNDLVSAADVGLCPRCSAELPVRRPTAAGRTAAR